MPRELFQGIGIGQYHFIVWGEVVEWINPYINKRGQLLNADIHSREKGLLVVKVPGHTAYIDRITRSKYAPTRIIVFRILHERPKEEDGREIMGERVLDFELTQSKKGYQ